MSFVPPLFKNFGKSLNDLLTKNYNFDKKLTVKTTTRNNTTFEATGKADPKSGDYTGGVKVTYKHPDVGTFEDEMDTTGKTSYSLECDKLYKGLVVKLAGTEVPSGTVTADYRQDHLAFSTDLDVSKKTTTVGSSVVVGYDGLSVGGSVKLDTNTQKVVDYNAGADYAQSDFTATVKTTDQADKITGSYIHAINMTTSVGGQFAYDVASGDRLFTLGTSHMVDRDAFVKGKINSNGVATVFYEQRLYNPVVKIAFSGEWNARNTTTVPTRAGVGLAFGEI